ncbi:hypothetical protein B425_1984 [Bacillus amyloliquefaciens]|nr:hypothetical protein LL3_01991 [Bacillus amyloliquefaciens LL3]KYC99655.1 hypothetical protein B425_1984 [Bacillus amyloliquefaciens]
MKTEKQKGIQQERKEGRIIKQTSQQLIDAELQPPQIPKSKPHLQ